MKKVKYKKLYDTRANNFFSNINNYLVRIDYFDKNGLQKVKSNIPIKSLLNSKSSPI